MHTRYRIAALVAFALAGGAAIPVPAPAASLPFTPAATQCKAGETVVYSCRFGKSVGSACMSAKAIHYRFGPLGRPTIDIGSNAGWSNIHTGGQYSHALAQDHVRFSASGYDYVIFTQEAGSLSDVPGKRFSGIYVMQGARDVARLECRGRPVGHDGWQSEVDDRAFAVTGRRAGLAEDDPRFDMYF